MARGETTEGRVRDFWVEGKGWNWQAIGDKLSHSALVKLALVRLNPMEVSCDRMGWLKTNEHFNGSSYDLYTGAQSNVKPWRGWTCIWKLHVQ